MDVCIYYYGFRFQQTYTAESKALVQTPGQASPTKRNMTK